VYRESSVLITVSAFTGSTLEIVSVSIYSATLFLLYLSSTLYHSFAGRVKALFRLFDHQSIYLLIAGTYTPFALLAIQGTQGWWILGVVWGLAIVGIILEMLPIPGPRIVSIVIYLLMGWCCVFAMDKLIMGLSSAAFAWLVAGGVIYTSGVVFYILDNWYPWCHEIWHLFVIGGSICHYISIFLL